jgi:predicted RNA-binding protein YlxR (DUF448 family)
MHVPRRRCVGCGRVAPKPELMRLASVPAGPERRPTATYDRAGTMPGRGAYVCLAGAHDRPSRECVKLATRKGTLQRAFRGAVEVPVELLESHEGGTASRKAGDPGPSI